MVICLERVADLHMSQLMPPPLTVSCFSKIQIGFTFLVPAYLGSTGKRAIKWMYVCMYVANFERCLAAVVSELADKGPESSSASGMCCCKALICPPAAVNAKSSHQ